LKDELENTNTWKSWRSDSSRRNGAILKTPQFPAALNTHSFGLRAIATDVRPCETISRRRRRDFFAGQRIRLIWRGRSGRIRGQWWGKFGMGSADRHRWQNKSSEQKKITCHDDRF